MSAFALALGLALPLVADAPSDARSATQAANEFALDLYRQLGATDTNVFFSPYSIDKVLAMTFAGARGGTAAQMARVLHLPNDQDAAHLAFLQMRKELNRNLAGAAGSRLLNPAGRVEILQAATLFGQRGYTFEAPFLKRLAQCYDATLQQVDFQDSEHARQAINAWTAKSTAGKIKDLMPPSSLDPTTRLALVSAIYFKGDWVHPFPKNATRPAPFLISQSRTAQVQMMSQTKTFGYAQPYAGLQILEMPYVGKSLSLVALLPSATGDLAQLERTLTADKLASWTAKLEQVKVQVSLPRFRLRQGYDLPPALQALGMKQAFTRWADFSGMTRSDPLKIDRVVHKAFLDVNELGTEAAAATGAGMHTFSLPPAGMNPVVFRADRPFLFAIRDTATGLILFLGRYADPTQGDG